MGRSPCRANRRPFPARLCRSCFLPAIRLYTRRLFWGRLIPARARCTCPDFVKATDFLFPSLLGSKLKNVEFATLKQRISLPDLLEKVGFLSRCYQASRLKGHIPKGPCSSAGLGTSPSVTIRKSSFSPRRADVRAGSTWAREDVRKNLLVSLPRPSGKTIC